MGLDVIAALAFYSFCISVKGLSPHPKSTWTTVRIVVQVFHRAFIIYWTLQRASYWMNGHPTSNLKDWLEEDMAYAIYLPILLLELIDASVRFGIAVRKKEYVFPSVKAFSVRSLPDVAVAASLIYLQYVIVHSPKCATRTSNMRSDGL